METPHNGWRFAAPPAPRARFLASPLVFATALFERHLLAIDMIMRLSNEFAAVEIARDDCGNGPRLMIRDLQTGQEIYLDPLELAALAWTRHEELLPLLDPGRFEREAGT